MEQDLMDALDNIYVFPIEVEFKEFRVYTITGIIFNDMNFEFNFIYDVRSTLESNVNRIVQMVDKEILKCYRKARI